MIHVPFRVVKGYFVVQKGAALMRTSSCIPYVIHGVSTDEGLDAVFINSEEYRVLR